MAGQRYIKCLADRVNDFIEYQQRNPRCAKLEYISGKWFSKQIEIKNIDAYLYECSRKDREHAYFGIRNPNDLEQWKTTFIQMVGDTAGRWYPNSIMQEALNVKDLKPLAFPLTRKQLLIISILLFHPEEEVFFITAGVGGSGKSTFGNIVMQLFEMDVANCSLSDLTDGFIVAEAISKRLIYSSELSSAQLENKIVKQLASKERIFMNPKGTRGHSVQSQSALLFNCNNVPRIDLTDTGMLRRIIYYYRNTKIENPDMSLKDKKFTRDELINIAATAYLVYTPNWRDEFAEETHHLLLKDNSVFILRNCWNYADYRDYCSEKGYKAYNEMNWLTIRDLIKEWGMMDVK